MVLRQLKRLIPDQHPLRLLWHKSKAFAAAVRYGFPARSLTVIGITGTDGKTTTVGMVAHILNKNGKKTGALSTAFLQIGDQIEWNATQKTSPSPFIIQRFLKRCNDEGCTHVVIEYSSHGLMQGRTLFTWPTIAAITNISEEHLDYHGTMDEYIRAKGLLFHMIKRGGTKVLNASDRTFEPYKKIPTTWSIVYASDRQFGPPAHDHEYAFWTSDPHVEPSGSKATIHSNITQDTWLLTLTIPGAFNIDNALCAISCVHACSISEKDCVNALATFRGIPGRIERIEEGQPFHVFIDFTVTPQSYEATLSTVQSMLEPGKRLLVLCGSCGDRMKEKRPVVGRIVSEYADIMVVANEDPYTEDPEKIIDDVWAGIDQNTTQAHRIFDRKKAIEFLLHEAKNGDAVVLCGKGSDTTMWVKEGKIPWNERDIVRGLLQALQK